MLFLFKGKTNEADAISNCAKYDRQMFVQHTRSRIVTVNTCCKLNYACVVRVATYTCARFIRMHQLRFERLKSVQNSGRQADRADRSTWTHHSSSIPELHCLPVRLLCGGYNYDSTSIRRPFDCLLKTVLNVFFFFASFKLPLFNECEMVFITA